MPHEQPALQQDKLQTPSEERVERDTAVVGAQRAILEHLFGNDAADEAYRVAWLVAHAAMFRELWDSDPEFQRAAVARDVREMLRRIGEAERADQS